MEERKGQGLAFSFGEPETVLSSSLTDYLGVFLHSEHDYYTPPVSLSGLAKVLNANAHHNTAIYFKRNMIMKYYQPNELLSASDMKKVGFEHNVFGMAYCQRITNRFGQTKRLVPLPTINMRRMKEPDRFCMLRKNTAEPIYFKPGEVIQIKEYDVNQTIYGIPQYLGGLQSMLLNESATLFRRKYYANGAHMGYIFYMNDPDLSEDDEKALKEAVKSSKGVGNFRSMFMNLPDGNKDSVKIIPVGDIATKDEFQTIKNISRNDIISAHRLPPALAGMMPENTGGFGDIQKISDVYYENEVIPMQSSLLEINEFLPKAKHIKFSQPVPKAA